ncbi:MAG: hypothetical protein V7K40_16870 [Nostoc sp.]|uniref:hypothetical protein n=1 Tax=Nostoc sp. TaxID=1180 RepID=UPI002FF57D39
MVVFDCQCEEAVILSDAEAMSHDKPSGCASRLWGATAVDGLRGIKEAVRPCSFPTCPLRVSPSHIGRRPRWLTAVYLRIWVLRGAIAFS